MYDDTVTIFNQFSDNNTIIWYPHVLECVELQIGSAILVQNKFIISDDKANLHIRMNEKYVKPKEWKNSQNKEEKFTLSEGDFFVKGNIEIGIVNDDDYPNGLFEYMKQQYDDVFNITGVNQYKAIPHFEVGGK